MQDLETTARTVVIEGPDGERRDIQDRRRRPTPAVSRYTFWGGRRREARRPEDAEVHHDRLEDLARVDDAVLVAVRRAVGEVARIRHAVLVAVRLALVRDHVRVAVVPGELALV
ncbi:MAG: hypothetical protein KC466_20910, partial [Myxococcales bacterium]|nr:hypothetical protein [Myxococcales bacterium]